MNSFPEAPGESTRQMRRLAGGTVPRPAREAYTFPAVGEVLADCLLLAELGRGVASRVYLAREQGVADRPVVLKVTHRTTVEHLSLGRLLHTHIVPLLFAQDVSGKGLRLLAMPYLGGAPLSAILAELHTIPPVRRSGALLVEVLDRLQADLPAPANLSSPLRKQLAESSYPDAVCWLGACLADALQHAHERGLIHLDVKPGNVLLAADLRPLLLDFHLAQRPLSGGEVPAATFGGTESYSPPEQVEALAALDAGRTPARPVDARADLYSLGVVLYEMLTGRLPDPDTAHACRELRRLDPQVSTGLADVLGRCLAADPERRYGDAAALRADLLRHLAHLPLRGVPNRDWRERWHKWRRRDPRFLSRLLLSIAALAGLAGGLGLAGWHVEASRHQAQAALVEGRRLLERGQPAEAQRVCEKGLEAGWFPGRARLQQALAGQAEQALGEQHRREQREQRAALVREMTGLADDVRFYWDVPALPLAQARKLERRCQAVWQRRALLDGERWSAREGRDFLDLVSVWNELRLRLAAPAEQEQARQQGRRVLREAERLAGPVEKRSAWGHYRQGRVLLAAGRLERAAQAFGRAVALQPDGFWPHFYEGVCALRLGRAEEAIAAFGACIALAPRSAPCYLNRALALTRRGRAAAAAADVEQALKLDPGLGPAWLQRGLLHARQGEPAAALTDLERALEHGADAFRVHRNLAEVYRGQGDRVRCRQHLREALRHRDDEATRRLLERLPE